MSIIFPTISNQREMSITPQQPSPLRVRGNLEEDALLTAEKANNAGRMLLFSALLAYLIGSVASLSNAGTILLGLVIWVIVAPDKNEDSQTTRTNAVSLKLLKN